MKNILTAFSLALCASTLPAQMVWFVDATSTAPAPNGLSWQTAFSTIHQALAAAQNNDEVWLARGTYKPTEIADRFAVFQATRNLAVYGGFAGTETQRDQRDWMANPTILTGDIGVPGDSSDNAFGILLLSGNGLLVELDGLIIEEANANNDDITIPFNAPTRSGGGIYLDGRGSGNSVWLRATNCTFRRNRAFQQGGAIFADGRDGGEALLTLENCVFEGNSTVGKGPCIAVENTSKQSRPMEVNSCNFHNNRGGAVWLQTRQAIYFSNCSFEKNALRQVVKIEGEGLQDSIRFIRCNFLENTPSTDGILNIALNNALDTIRVHIGQCRFYANINRLIHMGGTNNSVRFRVLVENCLFHQNYSQTPLTSFFPFGTADELRFLHCLFEGNFPSLINRSPSDANVPTYFTNSIALPAPNYSNPIFYGNTLVEHSLFKHQDCNQLGPNTVCGAGNLFDADPLFVDANPTADADFRLQPCSPAINAGKDSLLSALNIHEDLAGKPRIRHGVSDMGPYETVLLPAPEITNALCNGQTGGAVHFAPNLCPPYTITWPGGVLTGTALTGLPAGVYAFTVTDARGISFEEQVLISEPPPLQPFYTVWDASGPGVPDGAILFDSITGGTGAQLPDNSYGLFPGAYAVTITDANGCTLTKTIIVGFTVRTDEVIPEIELRLYPNPSVTGRPAFLEIADREGGTLTIFDFLGRQLLAREYAPDSLLALPDDLPPGLYGLALRSRSGKLASLLWVVW